MSSGTVNPGDFYDGTTVYWQKFGRWALSTLFLSFVLTGADLLTTAAAVARAGSAFVVSQVTRLLGSVVSIPVNVSVAAWQAPLPFLRALEFLSGPVGLGLLLAALAIVWTGVLD